MTSNNITGPSGAPTSNTPRGITGATGPLGLPGPTGAPTSNAPLGMMGVIGPVGISSTNYNSIISSGYTNSIASGTNNMLVGGNSNIIIGSTYNIVGGGTNITPGFQYSSIGIGSRPIVNRYIEIRGNGNVPDNKSRRMIIYSATDRDTCFSQEHITKVPLKNIEQLDDSPEESFSEENMSSAMFLSTDNGVWIETSEQGKYMNLVEMMEDYLNLKETVSELQDMVKDIYYAPPYGPGYLKAQALFESKVEEQNQ